MYLGSGRSRIGHIADRKIGNNSPPSLGDVQIGETGGVISLLGGSSVQKMILKVAPGLQIS
jgi:hypothetical protein